MLTIGGTTRVFLAVQPVDLRGSFDRLYGYVTEVLREDPRSGHWFCFVNKRHSRIKVLVFDGTGLWVLNKRSVSHCPLRGCGDFAVSTPPTLQWRSSHVRSRRSEIGHGHSPITRRRAQRGSGVDVRRG